MVICYGPQQVALGMFSLKGVLDTVVFERNGRCICERHLVGWAEVLTLK